MTDTSGSSREPNSGLPLMSYSRMNSMLTCGEQYRLERVLKYPARPHWAAVAGDAFHKTVETLLLDDFRSTQTTHESNGEK